jgi:hypothetical protein
MRKKVRGNWLIAGFLSCALISVDRMTFTALNCSTTGPSTTNFGASHGKVLMLFDLYEQTASISNSFVVSLTDFGAATFSINATLIGFTYAKLSAVVDSESKDVKL